ncbi:unnamed protein product [Caenorhabditis angaria]|uniref:LRRNT domain-containing protein n=1 Tax=Caenorhabditis angaria TaxID=860376 RepID=A0A9P1INE5_9PELO|nr:unnamed protein product [Caenorhabditis angaria]
MLLTIILLTSILTSETFQKSPYFFKCPERCQCYEDNEQKSQVHLICKWEQLNTTTFRHLQRPDLVRTLTIRCPHFFSQVSTPTPGLFQGFVNLDRLEIDRCKIDKVPNSVFAGLGQLISLIVKNANIRELPAEVFAYIPKLMTLDLSGNKLKIEPHSIRSLHELIHLDLSDNEIGFLTNTFLGLVKLRVITMNNNKITNIDFRRFPENLTDLSMRRNLISNIHYTSGSARNLKRLDLAGNMIEFISSSASGSVNVLPAELKHVDLSSNRLNQIYEGSINHMKHLVLLDLKNNTIKELRFSSLRGSKTQMKVFLSKNPLGCHCSHKWMTNSKSKNITIVDLPTVTCKEIIEPFSEMLLMLAESRNQLLCKYSNMCEDGCDCCEKPDCKCRFECPDSCNCWRSSDTSNIKVIFFVCKNKFFKFWIMIKIFD